MTTHVLREKFENRNSKLEKFLRRRLTPHPRTTHSHLPPQTRIFPLMQIETFKIFRDLAETGSFSRAAAANGITQSAVSQQIRALEQRYKVSLIERSRRAFALTAEGEAFLTASREIVDIYEHLDDRLKSLHETWSKASSASGRSTRSACTSSAVHQGLCRRPARSTGSRSISPLMGHLRRRPRERCRYRPRLLPGKEKGTANSPVHQRPTGDDLPSESPACQAGFRQPLPISTVSVSSPSSPISPHARSSTSALRDQGIHIQHAIEFDSVETVKRAVEIENGIPSSPAAL